MQLSHESYRTRWIVLLAVWLLAAGVLYQQAYLIKQYLEIDGLLGLRGAASPATPLQQPFPAFAADGQTWTRHALTLLEGNQIQLRHTDIDNAPIGREVHWNSAWAWIIAGAGWVYHLFTGLPLPLAVERATVWLAPTALLALAIVLSAWATRRLGLIAGVFIVVAMACNDRIYEGFFPTYVDHHGLLTVAVFGMTLGAVAMGAGWWTPVQGREMALLPVSPERVRSAAVFSALCGACGLWVSAASVIPPIAIVGFVGLLTAILHGRAALQQGISFDAAAWRLWGRVGAAASFLFYLLEYFPHHLGWRLEPNHPLYALAWLGGGELIALLSAKWLSPSEQRLKWTSVVWPLLAVAAAPATILIGGERVFIVLDPFLARLHRDYIQEFLPMWRTLQTLNAKTVFQVLVVDNLPLILGVATLTYKRRESPPVLWFATVAAFLFNVMAWWESRWMLNASGVQVCLALTLLACWCPTWRTSLRWIAAIVMLAVLYIPSGVMRTWGAMRDVKARRVSPKDANAALFRDIAAVLRASQPEGDIILLSSPNASTGIGYYGRFKTLGTLYWENRDGLKAAAAILSAASADEAATLIKARHVTHIAIVTDENFIEQYFQLLHPKGTVDELKRCFGVQLLVNKVVPQWLQMIPYRVPDDLGSLNASVMLFKVNFNQTLPEALFNVALSQIETGAVNEADRTLDSVLKAAPQAYQAWLKKGELLLARNDWANAADMLLKAIGLAPAVDRPTLYVNYAKPFYDARQETLAMRFYRTSLAERRTPDAACYLAWILSTSSNDSLRDGKEALTLAEEAIKADPTAPSYLNSLAAALAENGRFVDAVATADRAVANSRLRGEVPAIQQVFANRVAILKSGKPLRY